MKSISRDTNAADQRIGYYLIDFHNQEPYIVMRSDSKPFVPKGRKTVTRSHVGDKG